MLVSIIFYTLLLAMILCGGHFAKKGEFNENFLSLEVTKALQGISAICIVFHHISQQQTFQSVNALSVFKEIGFLFVGIFFFCSGFGLIKSLQSKPNYLKTFLRRRVLPMVLAYYVMIFFYLIFSLLSGVKLEKQVWIFSILGLTFFNTQCWYVIVITILYLVFYFAFTYVKKEKLKYAIILLAILTLAVFGIFFGHFTWWVDEKGWWLNPESFYQCKWWMRPMALWFQGEWWVNSMITFFVGMIVARFQTPLTSWAKKNYFLKLILLFILTGALMYAGFFVTREISYWSEFAGVSMHFTHKFLCLGVQWLEIIAFVLLIIMIMMKFNSVNLVSKFYGTLTLEVYLMQLIPILAWKFLITTSNDEAVFWKYNLNLFLYVVLVIASATLLAVVYHFVLKHLPKAKNKA